MLRTLAVLKVRAQRVGDSGIRAFLAWVADMHDFFAGSCSAQVQLLGLRVSTAKCGATTCACSAALLDTGLLLSAWATAVFPGLGIGQGVRGRRCIRWFEPLHVEC